jgi:hypothetical protein
MYIKDAFVVRELWKKGNKLNFHDGHNTDGLIGKELKLLKALFTSFTIEERGLGLAYNVEKISGLYRRLYTWAIVSYFDFDRVLGYGW